MALKPVTQFDSSQAKRCTACRVENDTAPCRECGGPAGHDCKGNARAYCTSPDCQAAKVRLASTAAVEKLRARKPPKVKVCLACMKTKALTAEHFYSSEDSGHGQRWSTYCQPCTRAYKQQMYASSPSRQSEVRARSERRREKDRARRAVDPAYDAEVLAYQREASRRARARVSEPEPKRGAGGDEIPVGPLVEFIDGMLDEPVPGQQSDRAATEVCTRLGISDRDLRAWRKGERLMTRLDIADRIVTSAGVLWFDVYDQARWPEAYAMAERAFEGVA